MSRVSKRRSIVLPTVQEDKLIRASAKADSDAQPLTSKQLKAMIPMRALRGRPKSADPKQLVSVRYSPEVLDYFKATGEGWQSRRGVKRDLLQVRHTYRLIAKWHRDSSGQRIDDDDGVVVSLFRLLP